MRTAIAAVFAGLVVAVAVVLGWQAVSSRTGDDDAGPEEALAPVVDALERGGDPGDTWRSGGDEVADARQALLDPLGVEAVDVTLSDIEHTGATATATLAWTVDTADVGELTWEASVEATRVRGEWGVDGSAATVHPDMRPGYRTLVERSDVVRAPIVGVDGESLTTHGDARVIGVAPEQILNEERLFTTWASVLPQSLEDLQQLLQRDDLNPDWFYPVVTVSRDVYDEVWTRLRAVPGVLARDATDTTPTADAFARHVLGRVGEPTAELAEELGVDPSARVGLYGLERAFEDQLVGSAQVRAVIVQDDGDEVAELGTSQDDPSSPLETTLDRGVQDAVENAMVTVGDGVEAAIVVLDATTSAVRATASRPLGGYNRAWEGTYPPGDALLPVAAHALIRTGASLEDPASCPDREAVAGALLLAPRPLGDTTLGVALAAGCDTSLGTAAARLDDGVLTEDAERFGFGQEVDLGLPSTLGSFPAPADATERVRAAAGQAQVLASPLHVASVVAAVAEGAWHPPYLFPEDGPSEPVGTLDAGTAGELRLLLDLAGQPTGSAAALGVPGVVGTAPVTGAEVEHAWAVGLVDDLAFAVLVEDTGGDPEPAARIARRFVDELATIRG